MKDLGIPEERVRLEWISASEGKKFAETVSGMVKDLKELGPSPFRTMWEI
jgi:F420-non-reducing hydrogenase iron-sulfur subunit